MISHLDDLLASSQRLSCDASSRIILMSDCHRGDGSASDDFLKNQNVTYHALAQYLNEGYTYIELGDGDEMWKNRSFGAIARTHGDFYELLLGFARANRLHMLYGNHDFVKKQESFPPIKSTGPRVNSSVSLYSTVRAKESLVLDYGGFEILLLHGHQVDFMNYEMWKLSRFLVRYLWRPLQMVGFRDPTGRNSDEKNGLIDDRLSNFAKRTKTMVIAGHTHQEVFAHQGEPLYFNDGSCVHPDGIQGIELANGNISLVRWRVATRRDGTLVVRKETMDGPKNIKNLFSTCYGT